MPRSRSRSASLDSLGRRRRDISSYSRRRRRSVSRSPSRSASRGRRRDYRSRSRSRSVERRRRRRSYSRSRSPMIQSHRRRSTSRCSTSRGASETTRVGEPKVEPKEKPNAMSHLSEEEQMRLLLGFGDFDSSKGKVVEENRTSAAVGTVRRDTKREYRQYMNRRGGFNRPLDKT
ncbi:unnamed protein product [Peronospora destructor]|uniref:U4/U6.U5 small nuclear ribonucleoprotein 27kDa protein domain-containing protein n=1 Tax=Peronospora destructor TaxID=86335 RepID=A0AAV0T9Z6_9STRA|nr:unnamed protein product [Peronospora destructor]